MADLIRSGERTGNGGRGLATWDPLADFDEFFERMLPTRRLMGREDTGGAFAPLMDVSENENEFVVTAELPGLSKDDIDVTVQDGVLTINAETKRERKEEKSGRVIRQERRYGRFVRSMRLGQIDEEHIRASYKDGVLELVLPKAAEAKPRRIDVDVT